MPDIRSIISDAEAPGYLILDSKQEGTGGGEYGKEVNYKFYLYKTRFFNKMKPGDLFLYRLPGGAAVDRKFQFYGGGRIASISEPDADGNVTATITEGFRFEEPLKQGDPKIEAIEWTSRTRKPKKEGSVELSWEHAFSQYGMNVITEAEFWAIVEGENCIPASASRVASVKYTEQEIVADTPAEEFTVTVTEAPVGGKTRRGRAKKVKTGKHFDYDAIQRKKNDIGDLGERIALNYEYTRLAAEGIDREPVYVAKTEGDGLGYDIRSWLADGTEIHIEVKATTGSAKDGFDMSPNEIEVSRSEGDRYIIYRLYDVNAKKGTAKICFYRGPIDDAGFQLEPTNYKVHCK